MFPHNYLENINIKAFQYGLKLLTKFLKWTQSYFASVYYEFKLKRACYKNDFIINFQEKNALNTLAHVLNIYSTNTKWFQTDQEIMKLYLPFD